MELSLEALAAYLDVCLESACFADDQHGIYRPSRQPIKRVGLALEPWPGLGDWTRENDLHALFLHRPWRLRGDEIPAEVGILSYHLAFDWKLTFGFNPRLATALGMKDIHPFARQTTFPRGMLGDCAPTPLDVFVHMLAQIFATTPIVKSMTTEPIQRLAVVGALSDTLVRAAAVQEAQLYITGEWRPGAQKAVEETALSVVVIGHEAGEWWGLRALSHLLRERWSALDVRIVTRPLPSFSVVS